MTLLVRIVIVFFEELMTLFGRIDRIAVVVIALTLFGTIVNFFVELMTLFDRIDRIAGVVIAITLFGRIVIVFFRIDDTFW